jgi:excisionase family DNA binding protein
MNIAEAAKYLFVSRPHVRLLLERGKITGIPTENGDYAIDDASVEKYKSDRKRAAKEYLDSQTEDKDPLGL